MKGRPVNPRAAPKKASFGNVQVRIYHVRRKADGRDFWQVSDYTTGKRRLITFADRDEAEREAARIAQNLAAGKVVALELSPAERAAYGRAIELLRPTGVSLEVAAATFAEASALLGNQPGRMIEAARHFSRRAAITKTSIGDAVSELIAFKKSRGMSARHLADLRNRLQRFASSFTGDLGDLTTPQLQRWLDDLGLSAQSVLNFRRVLSILFNHAVARGWVHRDDNPVVNLERVSVRRRGVVTLFTPEEASRILNQAQPPIRACLAITFFAGLRSKEVQRLDWTDVDLARAFIAVGRDKAKTASRRLVPIAPNLAEWLALDRQESGPLWPKREWAFHQAQSSTAERAGLSWRENAARHSFCSYRLAQIRNSAQVAMEAGNSQTMIHRHYAELVRPDEADQWFGIRPSTIVGQLNHRILA
ncbi:MAG: site-specific integrase [Verrucomicrobiales bacterium]|nr:site-specific integrase [Verrucomicrobiales bacterium]